MGKPLTDAERIVLEEYVKNKYSSFIRPASGFPSFVTKPDNTGIVVKRLGNWNTLYFTPKQISLMKPDYKVVIVGQDNRIVGEITGETVLSNLHKIVELGSGNNKIRISITVSRSDKIVISCSTQVKKIWDNFVRDNGFKSNEQALVYLLKKTGYITDDVVLPFVF